jgi:RNA polymerase sigma factor (sigma-70 family)
MSDVLATPIQRCLDRWELGDPAVRAELFQACIDRLRVLAHQLFGGFPRLHRWLDTDDVLQEACLRLDRCLQAIRPKTTRDLLGLAALQIRRELLDLVDRFCGPNRVATLHETPFRASNSWADRMATVPCDEREIDCVAMWTEFHRQVDGLPSNLREVFDLHWYDGLAMGEIARQLDVSQSTVKRRWLQARLLLADHLPIDSLQKDDPLPG